MELPPGALVALCALLPCQTLEVRERRRLLIIYLLCSRNQHQTALTLGHTHRTVRRWLIRGLLLLEQLRECPHALSEHDMKRLLLTTVADAPRPGAPPTYTAEQQCAIIGLAVRKPEELGLPIETWTNRELAEVADREKLATGISPRTVGRILAETDVKPHDGQSLQLDLPRSSPAGLNQRRNSRVPEPSPFGRATTPAPETHNHRFDASFARNPRPPGYPLAAEERPGGFGGTSGTPLIRRNTPPKR